MKATQTEIEGLLVFDLDVHGDNRGWFKENWQREKMPELAGFTPVQHNVSFNATAGVTRGLHAEPWDKLVSVAYGKVFGAWCDLREGSATYGALVTREIDTATAVFVPRGVANGFQALEETSYSYLVNDHWSPAAQYAAVNLDMVDWPLPPREISEKDRHHPPLAEATALPPRRVLVTGAGGQLGRALRTFLPDAEYCDRALFDVTNPPPRPWRQYAAIINCAAYNDVDGAETDRAAAWEVNALAPARLAAIAAENALTFVHVSSDFVFDGTRRVHDEEEVPSPLSTYGASKAAGEAAAQTCPQHYVVRTSWVFGEGANFIAAMRSVAGRSVDPQVVHDQRGRPTFAEDLAKGIVHLLRVGPTTAPYGVYNISGAGDAVGRDEVAMATFIGLGADPSRVHPVSTAEYNAGLTPPADQPARVVAPRPAESTLSLEKITATGFTPMNWRAALALYLALYPEAPDRPSGEAS